MNSELVTKRDLTEAVTELRGDMAAMKDELRSEMAAMGSELRGDMAAMKGDMAAMKTELLREIGVATSHVANVMVEEVRRLVTVVEEKYQDLPAGHARLRHDLDAHAADLQLHHRAPAPLPKRSRRSRAR